MSVPDVSEILPNWDIVDPGLELRVKKLLPFISHMKHQGPTEEEVFEAKASCHASEVEQVSGRDWVEDVLWGWYFSKITYVYGIDIIDISPT